MNDDPDTRPWESAVAETADSILDLRHTVEYAQVLSSLAVAYAVLDLSDAIREQSAGQR